MALISWNAHFLTHIGEIDKQHQGLVAMVNELHDAMLKGKAKDLLKTLLIRLVDYTKTHFGTEENLMRQHGYPQYMAHKALHDKLTAQVVELKSQLELGQPVLTTDVLHFLKNWLMDHIRKEDLQFGPFLIGKGVK